MCKHGADIANDIFTDIKVPVKLDIQTYDTETKPDVARTQAEKAVEAGCSRCLSARSIRARPSRSPRSPSRRGIPLVVNIAAAPPITELGYKFIVRNFPTAPMLLGSAFELQKQIFQVSGVTPKTAVLLSINDTFGNAMLGGIKAMFPKAGMPYEIVDTITYDAAAKDLSVEVAKAKASKAEMLMPICRLNDAKLNRAGNGQAALGADDPNQSRNARHVRAGLHQEHGQVQRVHAARSRPWLNPKLTITQVLEKHHNAKFPGAQIDINAGFTFEALLIAARPGSPPSRPSPTR